MPGSGWSSLVPGAVLYVLRSAGSLPTYVVYGVCLMAVFEATARRMARDADGAGRRLMADGW